MGETAMPNIFVNGALRIKKIVAMSTNKIYYINSCDDIASIGLPSTNEKETERNECKYFNYWCNRKRR